MMIVIYCMVISMIIVSVYDDSYDVLWEWETEDS